ncbi:MAG: Tfp pilus assembly protein FimT/FimU [Sulfurimonas sp.]|uniref:pilus assembly FimT family protein n=1 Tax=Sulfurimonas sp. TaxID=2022749 RepID=UPI003D142027
MKKAFTMMELVFVIVVIGILAAVIIPRIGSNKLQEAAIQVVSHIRYTQHLAMVDDKFRTDGSEWYKERWTLRFKEDLVYAGSYVPNGIYPKVWAYSIFSDKSDDRNPNPSEMAKNPLNSEQYMSGGYNNTLHVEDEKSMKELRLGTTYNIDSVAFSGGCRSNVLYIHFDYLGRPFNSFVTSSAYELASSGWHKLLTSPCLITLTDKQGEYVQIAIEPETGYVHIL